MASPNSTAMGKRYRRKSDSLCLFFNAQSTFVRMRTLRVRYFIHIETLLLQFADLIMFNFAKDGKNSRFM